MTMPVSSNAVPNPFRKGQRIVIPRGTPLRSTHPQREGVYRAGRDYEVTLFDVDQGYTTREYDWGQSRNVESVVPPRIHWPGSGGYWVWADVSDEMRRVNGVPVE